MNTVKQPVLFGIIIVLVVVVIGLLGSIKHNGDVRRQAIEQQQRDEKETTKYLTTPGLSARDTR